MGAVRDEGRQGKRVEPELRDIRDEFMQVPHADTLKLEVVQRLERGIHRPGQYVQQLLAIHVRKF